MGERRNRKSIWDTEHESKHMSGMREHDFWPGKDHHSSHDSGRYRDLADSRTASMRDSRDNSGWPSWDSIEDPIAPMSRGFKNTYGGKDIGGEKRYHKNISPEFNEMELRDYNHTNEYDRSHSQRYVRKGRSRSRSRTHGRSRSRSLSRGREKERERGRGWSRSRSRSRSDGYGYGNAHRRSHSPIGDYRRQPYGWSDKRSGQEKSSQTCRDFVAGRCRNGSQCRFFHPDSRSRRDDLVEDDRVESWRGRSDHSHISKHSYTRLGFESRKDVSELYRGENEQFLNKSRAKIPCRDFRMGNCRWGDTCKFSHDEASAESFDHQQFINEKRLCMFFAAGRCTRDNCRFSHDDPNLKNLDDRLDKVTERKSSHENSNWWSAPKWDDTTGASDAPIPTGWDEAIATNTTSTGDITNDKSDSGWGFKSNDDSKIWGVQEWTTSSLDSERQPSHPMENESYGVDMHPAKSFAEDNVTQKQDLLILNMSQLQNKDGIANLHGLTALPENQNLAKEALQQNVPPSSHIQQQHFGVTSNPMSSFGSAVRDEIKDTRYTNNPVLLSGQIFNRNDTSTYPRHSLLSNESDRGQNMLYANPSNGLSIDLNRPETHMINPLNLQIHGQNDKSTVQSPGSLEARGPEILMHLLTSKHPDQVSNSLATNDGRQVSPVKVTVSPTPSFVNEHSQTSGVIDVSNSRGMMLSLSCIAGYPPLVSTSTVEDNKHAVSLDQLGSSRENIERGNLNLAQATDSRINQMQPNRSPPPSIVVRGVESSKLKHPEIPRQQGETVANLTGDSKATGEESKDMQDNRPSENLDGQGKPEERSANKDEKGMRLFKNCLVELVKEILKPTWKEGRMTRDVHKSVVKKVVEKVSSTIQAEHIPKTQDKVDLYLSSSKPKITKLVQAYVDRSRKPDA